MPFMTRRVAKLRRTGFLAASLLRSTAVRPATGPLKVTLCLTYRCQSRCRTCNIWQRQPCDELTAGEIAAFVRATPQVTWVDLTGGEIFLRPDISTILDEVAAGWPRLAVLHFPTNGLLTDTITRAAERLAGHCPARTIVTVSVDGDAEANDEVRGVKGGFARQIATFNALRQIPGLTAVLGVTLSSHNAGTFTRIVEACAREVPGLTSRDLHVNVAQVSTHYYGNDANAGLLPTDGTALSDDLRAWSRMSGFPRTPAQALEHAFQRNLNQFLTTGRTPMRCHALRASCFVDPCGVVYPCSIYSRPLGSLRDTAMQLGPLWASQRTRDVQREIWEGACPQCWTACEAYQTMLGNLLAGRWRLPRPHREPATAGETGR